MNIKTDKQITVSYGYYDYRDACREDESDTPIPGWDGEGWYVLVEYPGEGERCEKLVGYDTEPEAKAAFEASRR